MMDAQPISSKRMDNQSGRDLLSDLPLGIIHNILALVPIIEAVRTCVLAKQWRYIWTSLPQLVFTEWDSDLLDEDEDRLISFINNVLILHKGPILNFEISTNFSERCPNIDNWLLSLSRKDIRELHIHLEGNWLEMPSSLYSCQTLTRLEFLTSELPAPPPTFKGFLCLRCLNVRLINEPCDVVESLVASSPLLENLTLEDEFRSSVLRISAPNLKYFQITSIYKEICVHAPLLVKVSVKYDRWGYGLENDDDDEDEDDGDYFTVQHIKQESSVCNYTKLLGSCTNLESLRVDYFTKFMSVDIESYQSSLVFHHLKLIQLHEVSFLDVKVISVVLHLIADSPNLQKLEISVYRFKEDALKAALEATHDGSIWDSECASSFTCEKLRTIEMKKIRGLPNEMEFIKILLKSSPVLETMTLDHTNEVGTERIVKLMSELLSYDRASSNAKILFNPYLSLH